MQPPVNEYRTQVHRDLAGYRGTQPFFSAKRCPQSSPHVPAEQPKGGNRLIGPPVQLYEGSGLGIGTNDHSILRQGGLGSPIDALFDGQDPIPGGSGSTKVRSSPRESSSGSSVIRVAASTTPRSTELMAARATATASGSVMTSLS